MIRGETSDTDPIDPAIDHAMYLSHLIFMLGLALTFCSIPAALLLVFHVFWFQRRVREDERHLTTMFGETYRGYLARVKRWIPGVI